MLQHDRKKERELSVCERLKPQLLVWVDKVKAPGISIVTLCRYLR